MSKKKILLISVGAFILIIVAMSAAWYLLEIRQIRPSTRTYSSTDTPSAVLMQINPSFAQGQQLRAQGSYSQAISAYEDALKSAQDPIQEAQIRFDIAATQAAEGDPIQAIQTFQAIAANKSYTLLMRAYSVSAMAEMIYQNGDPTILAQVFSQQPYTSFIVPGDQQLTYRHLEEYAVSFYPLALPELRIAGWYAGALQAEAATSSNPVNLQSYMAIINQDLASADADIARTKDDPVAGQYIPFALLRKAIVLGRLATIGQIPQAQADAAFSAAFNIAAATKTANSDDGFVRYYDALYLASLGSSHYADVRSVLAPLDAQTGYENSAAFSYFKTERRNALGQKSKLQMLATIDPGFKTLLVSLGWRPSDFQ